jgi:hypothetical protein
LRAHAEKQFGGFHLRGDAEKQFGEFHLRAHAEKQFGEFHLRAHNEFFGYFVEQWLENEEIPVVLWSCTNLT